MRTRLTAFASTPGALIGGSVLGVLVFIAVFGGVITPFNPQQIQTGPLLAGPSGAHWLGTDQLGRDVLSRVFSGVRVSLLVGFGSAVIATAIGVAVGATAGYFGGFLDAILSRITEIVMVVPSFFLAIVVVAIFGQTLLDIVVTIGVLTWPIIARVARAEFISLRRRGYVEAARVLGASDFQLMWHEILPNAAAPIAVTATLQAGAAMLLEAGLSYLGLGDPNQASLGLQLEQAQGVLTIAWWVAVFPGVVLFVAVLCTNLVGDGVGAMFTKRRGARSVPTPTGLATDLGTASLQ